jgi:hypothetical protein
MHRYLKPILLSLLLISSWSLAQTISSGAGTASGLLLRFDPNPRVAGLASAFTALADDENALLYNPAALSNFQQGMVSLNHTQWFADIKIDNITAGYNLTDKIGLGLAFTHLWMPDFEIPLNEFGDQSTKASVSSSVLQLGVGYSFTPALRAGIALKYLNDKLDDFTANAFGADLGVHARFLKNRLSAGLAVQNLGSKMKFDVEEQEIPLTVRGGVAWCFADPNLNLSLDVLKARDTDVMVLAGVEVTFLKQFSLRAGNRASAYKAFDPAFGVGFSLQEQYYLNYSYMNFSDLGGTHRIGFSYHFDTPATGKKLQQPYQAAGPVLLIPPAGVSVEISQNELHINWERVAGVQYNVYARHSSQKDWVKLNKEMLYNNQLKFKKPTTSGIYTFRVCSVLDGKESTPSKEASIDVK